MVARGIKIKQICIYARTRGGRFDVCVFVVVPRRTRARDDRRRAGVG